MKFIVLIHFILFLILISTNAYSCSCTSLTEKYIDKIDLYDFAGRVKVLKRDTIYHSRNEKIWQSCTTVKVINQYKGEISRDTLQIIDSKGFECFGTLRFENIGDEVIVKGFDSRIENHLIDYNDPNLGIDKVNKGYCLELFLCDVNQLNIVDNYVVGYITLKRNGFWDRIRKFIGKHISALDKSINNYPPQKMTISEFESKI